MQEFRESVKKELDNLVNIATTYRDGDITESLFLDVVSKYKNNKESLDSYKNYLQSKNVKIISDSSEIDDLDYDGDENIEIKPYDTRLIDISPKTTSLDTIISRLENDEIDLMPDFQRKSGLWSIEQKSQLIESLILRIPLPAFYFDGSTNDMWIIIDGLQRLTTLKEFFVEKTLKLKGLEFLSDLEGLAVDDMPRVYIRRMKETQIIAYIINPGAPVNLKYNIFKRINTGGLKLEPQEIRHALFQGFATSYIKELADMELFKEATGYSISSNRMLDREFVLRFLAFYELKVDEYKGSIDDFLNNAMDFINKNYIPEQSRSKETKKVFERTLEVNQTIFGKFAFRRMPDMTKKRPISKALFETWTVVLSKYSDEALKILASRKGQIMEQYMKLCLDKEFVNSIGSGKVSSVRKRFEIVERFVEERLNNDK